MTKLKEKKKALFCVCPQTMFDSLLLPNTISESVKKKTLEISATTCKESSRQVQAQFLELLS